MLESEREQVQQVRKAVTGTRPVGERVDQLAARVGLEPMEQSPTVGLALRSQASGHWYDVLELLWLTLDYVDARFGPVTIDTETGEVHD